jgi:hypothetical protein
VSYKYYALNYLNQWLSRDRGYCDEIVAPDRARQRKAIRSAAGFYRIARNLPKEFDIAERFGPVLDIIQSVQPEGVRDEDVLDLIKDTHQRLSRVYGNKGTLSATTKFLWLRIKNPVIIYDSQARKALKTPDQDIGAFYAAWRVRFDADSAEIRSACESLPGVIDYCINPKVGREYVETIAKERWFEERVLDNKLWALGR